MAELMRILPNAYRPGNWRPSRIWSQANDDAPADTGKTRPRGPRALPASGAPAPSKKTAAEGASGMGGAPATARRDGAGAPEPGGPKPLPELIDVARIVGGYRRHRRAILLCCLLGLLAGVGSAITATLVYTSYASILVSPATSQDQGNGQSDWGPNGFDVHLQNQVRLLGSEAVAGRVLDTLSPEVRAVVERQAAPSGLGALIASLRGSDGSLTGRARRQELLDTMAENFGVSRDKDASTLSLAYSSPNPDASAAIVNAYLASLRSDLSESYGQDTADLVQSLNQRVRELQSEKTNVSDRIQAMLATNPELAIAPADVAQNSTAAELQRQLGAAMADLARATARHDQLTRAAPEQRLALVMSSSADDPALTSLREDYANFVNRQATTATMRTSGNADERLDSEAARLQAAVDAHFERMLSAAADAQALAQSQVTQLRAELAKVTRQAVDLRGQKAQLASLQSQLDVYDQTIRSLQARRDGMIGMGEGGLIRTITPATIPLYKSGPSSKMTVLIFLVIGGILGAGYAAAKELRDRSFRTPEQVKRLLGLTTLAEVPRLERGARLPEAARSKRQRRKQTGGGYLEAMRWIDQAISRIDGLEDPAVVAFSPAAQGSGATTTARNLAMMMSRRGARVLLVDGDRHGPQGLSRQLKLDKAKGLWQLLYDEVEIEDCIVTSKRLGCDVLPAGRDAQDDATSDAMLTARWSLARAELSGCYDIVLLDLPAPEHRRDLSILACDARAVLLVIGWGDTDQDAAQKARRILGQQQDSSIFAVLNRVDPATRPLYADLV